VTTDVDWSLARIEVADLLLLTALAAEAEAELFESHPRGFGRYAARLLGLALCQGAALHYVNGKNGVKDFDVSFYAQYDDGPSCSRCWASCSRCAFTTAASALSLRLRTTLSSRRARYVDGRATDTGLAGRRVRASG
jgi:hypothetical protein